MDKQTDPATWEQSKLAKKIKNFVYHPGDLIGSGFSSQVYRGINELQPDPNKKTIAIKVIELSKIQNEVQHYLLNNEVTALKVLSHENILHNYDTLMTKNNVYIVTEFCEGGDMLKYIKGGGPLSELKALTLIKDIIEGYKCIEQHHIIHRDLKTSNIFLSRGRAKIADFGFCEFVGEKKPQIAYNVGSPAYMSPQSYKQNQYSHKSDIWSIGIILYEMLFGETPDRNLTYTEMANNLMSGKIKHIKNEEIKRILCLCFKKNFHERIDSITLSELITSQLLRQQAQLQQKQIPPQFVPPKNQISPSRTVSPNKRNDGRGLQISKSEQSALSGISSNQNSTVGSAARLPPSERPNEQAPSHRSMVREQSKPNPIKPHTDYLLFLYRLLKFVMQLKLDRMTLIPIPIFRHRSLIESLAELQVQQMGSQQEESYKQFQYLKRRFDEVYLEYTKQTSTTQKKMPHKDKLDQLANIAFLHPESLHFYRNMLREASIECLGILEGRSDGKLSLNRNQVGIVLDYMMIEHELFGLHLQNISLPDIIMISKMENIIKEQPKKLNSAHVELLKIKFGAFVGGTVEYNTANAGHPQVSQPQGPIVPKEAYQQPRSMTPPPSLHNGDMLPMGYAQPHPQPPPIAHPQYSNSAPFIQQQPQQPQQPQQQQQQQQQAPHQNIPLLPMNNPYPGQPLPPIPSQQNMSNIPFSQIINQMPIHQSIMMHR